MGIARSSMGNKSAAGSKGGTEHAAVQHPTCSVGFPQKDRKPTPRGLTKGNGATLWDGPVLHSSHQGRSDTAAEAVV